MSAYNRNDKTKGKSQKTNIFDTIATMHKTSIQLGANINIASSNDDKVAAGATNFPKATANKQPSLPMPSANYSTRAKTPLQMKAVPLPTKPTVTQSTNMTAPLFPVVPVKQNGTKTSQSQFKYPSTQAKSLIPVVNPASIPSKVLAESAEMPPVNVEVPPASDEVPLESAEKALDAMDLQIGNPEEETTIDEEYYENLSQIYREYQTKTIQKVKFAPHVEEIGAKQAVQPANLFKEKMPKRVDEKPADEEPSEEELVDSIVASEKPPMTEPAHIDDQVSIEKVNAHRYIIHIVDDDDIEIVIKRRKL